MTPHQFAAKWKAADLSERSAYQQHFLDLCALLNEKTPAEVDPTGQSFTFEKGVDKDTGGKGFADVWRRGCFGWEYKGKHKDLTKAYAQLLNYREALENPPLLIVCDLSTFVVRTNFTGTPTEKHEFDLDGLADPKNLELLRRAFADPYSLKPGRTQKQVTEDVAKTFAAVADGMRGRGIDPHAAGHFLMKLMFCMFAEDIELLPKELFLKTLRNTKADPAKLAKLLGSLFEAMAEKGGTFGADEIPWVNGGLFKDAEVLVLTADEIRHLEAAAALDWSAVEPSIFGTLFERILNPEKRSQLGAHYTGRDDILTLLEPVLMAPLRAEWADVKAKAETLWEKAKGAKAGTKPKRDFENHLAAFLARLEGVTVLDPACGSGNFLYVALHLLLDLEKEVLTYYSAHALTPPFPGVRPTQLRGIELNPYAQELAQVVIWIGYIQWMRRNGFVEPNNPVLDGMENIQNRDAVLDLSDPANPKEPDWPDAEFIVGNPPFLGSHKFWDELGREYQEGINGLYKNRVPGAADLCCYWFEKARAQVKTGKCKRARLISTQAIRGGYSREVLNRIKSDGDIFFARSDMAWLLDGAVVHISMVGFDDGTQTERILDDATVQTINANLTSNSDVTRSQQLIENAGIAFSGTKKSGEFNVSEEAAIDWLRLPNPHGKPNSDLMRPWLNGTAIVQRPAQQWIIDTGVDLAEADFAYFEQPYAHALGTVKPERDKNKREHRKTYWWLHAETCPGMRAALMGKPRFLVTPRVSKFRLFLWVPDCTLGDDGIYVFARDDDYFFGALHSRVHEVWARSQGTQVRERESGFRYTPKTCFLTFPFPEPNDTQRAAIAAAAKTLDELRNNWLNPAEWVRQEVLEFPGSVDGPWRRFVVDANERGIGTVKYPRLVAKPEHAAELKKRTLTNLYNARPAWLDNAHKTLDAAVLTAYGWPTDVRDDDLLARLLALNLSRAGTSEAATDDADE